MSHLQLVATQPAGPAFLARGYHECRARGICQRCHARGEVRTAGLRQPGDDHWTWLALCGGCRELAAGSGHTVVLALPGDAPATMAELAEIFSAPPAAPGRRTVPARFPGRCSACGGPIAPGDPITCGPGRPPRWRHAGCFVT